MSSLYEELVYLNCAYNYKESSDGKCYYTTCMVYEGIGQFKESKGCKIFNCPEVQKILKEKKNESK